MKILILTDIFGKVYLSNELINFSDDLIILDPYEDELFSFSNEEEAYQTYIEKCGHEKYFQKALNICQKKDIELILGFSAGGTIAWRLSSLNFKYLKKVICFYPSQIRNYLELDPIVSTYLIFAKYESSFNTDKISNFVLKKENVKTEISLYNHGFMNKNSRSYDEIAFNKYLKQLKNMIYL